MIVSPESASAWLPEAVRSAYVIARAVSSLPPASVVMVVSVGASLTAAVLTLTCTAAGRSCC